MVSLVVRAAIVTPHLRVVFTAAFRRPRQLPWAIGVTRLAVSVLEGFHYLFHPVNQRVFEHANSREHGEIHHVEVRLAKPAPDATHPRHHEQRA